MTTVACPKCADSVTLPLRASQRATVRCPLCQETFPLADVLDKMPPTLIVVDDPDAAGARHPAEAVAADVMAETVVIERESNGGGFAPLSIETARSGAPATAAPARRRPTGSARRKPKNPVMEGAKIVLGGLAGLVIAQLILWCLGSYQVVKVNGDPMGLGPKVARYVPWIVPERYRGQKTPSAAAKSPELGAPAVARLSDRGEPKGLPKRRPANPFESAPETGAGKSPRGKAHDSEGSQESRDRDPLTADTREADPRDAAAAPANPAPDLTTAPEAGDNPLADMKLDTELPLDNRPLPAPAVNPAAEAKEQPTEEPKPLAQPLPNAPRMTGAELASAADEAKTVLNAWGSASPADSRELIRQSYVALAKLGEALAFRAEPAGAQSQTAAELVQALAGEDAKVDTLGRVAGGWLKAVGRDSSGVLLVGVVKQVRRQGGYEVIELALAGSDQPVPVYRKPQPNEAYPPDSKLLVLGAIVEDPSKNLVNYEGEARFVVWEGLSTKLPTP